MTDCMLFASLFATYAVLRDATNGGPSGADIFSLSFVFTETVLLLVSSFVCGITVFLAQKMHASRRTIAIGLSITALLGLAFIGMELYEFLHLASEGHTWQQSAFLSAYFTLVGTHGLHIVAGLLWAGFLLWQLWRQGSGGSFMQRLMMFAVFWHFLDVVWVFIFSVVYLWGVLI